VTPFGTWRACPTRRVTASRVHLNPVRLGLHATVHVSGDDGVTSRTACFDVGVRELPLPPVRYVNIADESIAYRDHGGPGIPIVYLGGNGSHQDLIWEEPGYAHFLRSLAALGRLVSFDRRGCGLSSRTVQPTIEVRVEDLDRVLDATGVEQAVLVAAVGSTQTALAFGAMRPDRTRALVLYSASARLAHASDYEVGIPDELFHLAITGTESVWGTGFNASIYMPSLADDDQYVEWQARYERSAATPVESRQWVAMYWESDIRDVLPLVRAPTLVVTPTLADDFTVKISRYVANHLADVRAIDIEARDQYPHGDGMNAFLEATSQFLVDVGGLEPVQRSYRRLAAVLFTDLVASTDRQRSVGDQRWATTMDSHDSIAERAVGRNRGRIIKSTGDGVLAIFDGPESAVAAAIEILQIVGRIGLMARAGVHVGELEERGDDVSGIAVTLCSRIVDHAAAEEILVSSTVKDLVAGSGLQFEERGAHRFKGLDDPVQVLAVSLD
jgi:class 3 adenylate cyclase